jgi:hypothetical protein
MDNFLEKIKKGLKMDKLPGKKGKWFGGWA